MSLRPPRHRPFRRLDRTVTDISKFAVTARHAGGGGRPGICDSQFPLDRGRRV